MNTSIIRLSKWISNLFNPIISLTFFFIYYGFHNGLTYAENWQHFGLIFGLIIFPIIFWITWNVKTKRYTNADVSDRNQRKTLYFFIEGCLGFYLIIYYFLSQMIDWVMLFILILTLVMQWSNYFVKSSMHTAFNVFTSFLFFTYNPTLGIIWGILTVMVAITRIILKRHTPKEIVWGTIISVVISFMYLYTQILTQLKN